MKVKYFFLFLIIFFCGCAKSNFTVNVISQDNKIVVENNLDATVIEKLQNITPGFNAASEKFIKKDFLIFVIYEFKVEVAKNLLGKQDTLPYDFPFGFEFRAVMPGKIKETNAQKIENNTAVWLIEKGSKFDIYAKSIKIRYWMFLIIGYIILRIIYIVKKVML